MHYRTITVYHLDKSGRIDIFYCNGRRWAKIRRLRKRLKGEIYRIAKVSDLKAFNAQNNEDFRQWYVQAIAKKYGVGLDWEQNRYFVEQVRPNLGAQY